MIKEVKKLKTFIYDEIQSYLCKVCDDCAESMTETIMNKMEKLGLCQLFKDNPDEPKFDYPPDGSGKELEPDKDRLLTPEEMEPLLKKYPFNIFAAILKEQDAKTASILKATYAKDMEHLSHLVDDVIILEGKLKEKDAEINEETAAWQEIMMCVDRNKDRECQARVERIKGEIEKNWQDVSTFSFGTEWQEFWRKEGVK